jgi:hypothetical protein
MLSVVMMNVVRLIVISPLSIKIQYIRKNVVLSVEI